MGKHSIKGPSVLGFCNLRVRGRYQGAHRSGAIYDEPGLLAEYIIIGAFIIRIAHYAYNYDKEPPK